MATHTEHNLDPQGTIGQHRSTLAPVHSGQPANYGLKHASRLTVLVGVLEAFPGSVSTGPLQHNHEQRLLLLLTIIRHTDGEA